MSMSTKDGQTGNLMKVDSEFRAWVRSISQSEAGHATVDGRAFNLNTGQIVITTTTAVIYVKNNEDEDLFIDAIAIGVGKPLGGNTTFTNVVEIFVVRNPTAGTMVSANNNVDMNINMGFGSSETLDAVVLKGASGETFTDGADGILIDQNGTGRVYAPLGMALKKGNSMGIRIVPNQDATNVEVYAAVICHLRENV